MTIRNLREAAIKLNTWAAEVTGGAVHLGFIGDAGDGRGVKFVDAHDAGREFTGRSAARQAALFIGFAAHEYVTRLGGEYPPAWVDELLLALLESSTTEVSRSGDAGLDHVDTILPRHGHLTLVAAA